MSGKVIESDEHTSDWYEHQDDYDVWFKWWRDKGRHMYDHPDVTIDAVMVTYDDSAVDPRDSLKIMLIRRAIHPFKGDLALPGTFLASDDENIVVSMKRMLKQRFDFTPTGYDTVIRQLKTFTDIYRDPRGQVVSIAHLVYIRDGMKRIPEGSSDYGWVSLRQVEHKILAFDHYNIVETAIDRMRSQFAWKPDVFSALPRRFTISQALRLRAGLFNRPYDDVSRKNFRTKYVSFWGAPAHEDENDPNSPVQYSYFCTPYND